MRSTPTKTTIESEWEALLTEMRQAREYGVPGIGAREIAEVERKLARVLRRKRESMRAVARIFRDCLGCRKSMAQVLGETPLTGAVVMMSGRSQSAQKA